MHFDGIWFCRHFRICRHDWSCLRMTYNVAMSACERWREVFLLWEEMRRGDKVTSCICVVGDSLENNRFSTDWWDSRRFHEPSPHFGVSIYVNMYLYIDIQQDSLLHIFIYTHVSITSIVKLNTFLPPTFAASSIFSVSDSPKTSKKQHPSSGRRMWKQTPLASMSCWAWELRGVVANCAWKRCCLGEKGKGWSN